MTDSPSAPEPIPPPHWEADVLAADGATVHLRPIRSSDADALVAFHAGLSTRTRYLRYFSAYPRIPDRDLYRFTHVDHHDRVALVVLLGAEIIAVGRYEREVHQTVSDLPSEVNGLKRPIFRGFRTHEDTVYAVRKRVAVDDELLEHFVDAS